MLDEPHRRLVTQIFQHGMKATVSMCYPTSYKYQRHKKVKSPCVHKNTTKQTGRKKLGSLL